MTVILVLLLGAIVLIGAVVGTVALLVAGFVQRREGADHPDE